MCCIPDFSKVCQYVCLFATPVFVLIVQARGIRVLIEGVREDKEATAPKTFVYKESQTRILGSPKRKTG